MRLCRLQEICWTALFLSAVPVTGTYAAGLGILNLESALGAPLRASIPLLGHFRLDGAHCIGAKLASLDGAQLGIASATLESRAQASVIHLRTERGINEPVVNIVVNIGCGVSVHRQYQVLLDPVGLSPAALLSQSAPAPEVAHSASAYRVVTKKKSRHSHTVRNPSPSAAGAPARTPRHAKARPSPRKEAPVAKPPHSILRLGPTDSVKVYRAPRLQLRLSDHLTLPPVPASEPVAPAAAQRDQELKQRLLDSLEAEATSLRAKTARIKQENSTYRSALEGKHNDSLNWIKGLGLLLLAGAAAVGWLLWRMMTMKQSMPHPWHELFSNQEANTIDSALMAGNTEFSTTALDLSELHTEQFDTVTSSSNGPTLSDSLARIGMTLDTPLSAPQPEPAAAQPASDAPTPAAVLPEPVPAAPECHARSPSSDATAITVESGASSLKAEEVSDVMELAQVWMTLNAPEKVLELLKPFSEVEQPESPLPWLCLLDVYRALGDRPKYDAILDRIKTIFNAKLAPWTPLPYVELPKVLSDFPHVMNEIISRWQAGDAVPYLERLLVDDRNGTRHGFDLPVYRDILQLIDIAGSAERLEGDEVMPENAYRLLFGQREPAADNAGNSERCVARTPATSATPARLPVRPRYMTPSYQRKIAKQADKVATISASTSSPSVASAQAQPEPAATTGAPPSRGAQEKDRSCDPPAITHFAHDPDMTPMLIKLHLATAYKDIGDKEGACLLLDEVIHEGTPEQSEQARKLRAQLV